MANTRLQIFTTLILFCAIITSGCYYDDFIPIGDAEITGDVSFSNDIIPIFNKDCNTSGCHNTGGQKPDLSPTQAYLSLTNGNYLDTNNPEESTLYQWMKGNRALPMPVSGSVPGHNAKVLAWIKQGIQNN